MGKDKKQSRKQRQAEQLGTSIGAATARLRKMIIHKLLVRLGENKCVECGDWISSPDDFAIGHEQEWLDGDPDLFWDYDNVVFGHPDCLVQRAAKRQEEKMYHQLVQVTVEDEDGNWLPAVRHEDKIYVLGKMGDRYLIRVRNLTNERVEAVVTVDGRDVITGNVGSTESRGYILRARESYAIPGFRKSDRKVAAFRFGEKRDSYSSQRGTGQHVGVIGVAVFRERSMWGGGHITITPCSSGVSGTGVHIYNTSAGGTYSSSGMVGSCSGSDSAGGPVTLDSNWTVSHSADGISSSATCSTAPVAASAVGPTRLSRKRKGSAKISAQSLGTEYGESLTDEIGKTFFTRASVDPDEMYTFEYDSLKGLRARGLPISVIRRLNRRSKEEPHRHRGGRDPFPADPEYRHGYVPPPPRRNY